MAPFPACESAGLADLCQPAQVITGGSWFLVQVPNLLWFLTVLTLILVGLFAPFPDLGPDLPGEGEQR